MNRLSQLPVPMVQLSFGVLQAKPTFLCMLFDVPICITFASNKSLDSVPCTPLLTPETLAPLNDRSLPKNGRK